VFPDDSIVRRINGESVLLVTAGRALLMQIAHPLVAAGVDQHSSFQRDRVGRLMRTIRSTYGVLLGDERQAADAAAGIRRAHQYVVGPDYTANDPDLLLWVHASFVDCAIDGYRRFVRPLSGREAEAYYFEIAQAVEAIGMPASHIPPTFRAFETYVADMIESMEIGEVSRRLAHEVLQLRPAFLAPALATAGWFTAGLLPPRLREAYGLRWTALDARLLAAIEVASRALVPRLPVPLRRPPALVMPPKQREEMAPLISRVITSRDR